MENMSRRKFLKLSALTAGMGLLAGCGVKAEPSALGGGHYTKSPEKKAAKNWGMLIDSNKISSDDIKRMQQVCHKAHNVPHIPNEKHEVKWIWEEPYDALFFEETSPVLSKEWRSLPFTTLCNQCRHPICVKVCPTRATFTNDEGVIMQDMHRCIGCRNCMAACPYGSRSFNFVDPRDYLEEINPNYPTRMKGVVEKCDFCMERLNKGERPLCVEASKGAILFGDLDDPDSEISRKLAKVLAIQRRPSMGTDPKVFYQVNLKGGDEA